MRKYVFVLPLLLAALLPACGLKGPLYLPGQKPAPDPSAVVAPPPATPADDKKNPASK